ncbi:hypothetical protein CEXT_623891 [Caerostris extrusa]|uniref:Uncharacterized protein n=1 Tax=Caerostris extrusa TaxID=172846 RepID=A0AAV4MGT5_CAEEX|nr:hypothetical protein CEXT_623891 [Caerostris extrusa]
MLVIVLTLIIFCWLSNHRSPIIVGTEARSQMNRPDVLIFPFKGIKDMQRGTVTGKQIVKEDTGEEEACPEVGRTLRAEEPFRAARSRTAKSVSGLVSILGDCSSGRDWVS